jgi:hypothetical protein
MPLSRKWIFQTDALPKNPPAGDGFAIEALPVWRMPKE